MGVDNGKGGLSLLLLRGIVEECCVRDISHFCALEALKTE